MSITDNICSDYGCSIHNAFCVKSSTVNIGVYSIDCDAMGWFHNHANVSYDFGSVGSVVGMNVREVAARQVILPDVAVLHANTFSRKVWAAKTLRSHFW
jgi:hypothetical protein